MLARRPGSAIKPVGSPVAPLRALVAQAATRQRLHKLGQISGVARIPRRTRTPERTLPPLLPRLPALIVFSPHSSRYQLEAHCLTTVPSAQISRLRGNLPRSYHRPRSPQLRLRPRRNCSDPPLAAKSMREDVRTQRRFPRCRTYAELLRGRDQYLYMKELVQAAKRSPNIGRPLFDSAFVASSCNTSQCSARRPFSIRTISAAIQATGGPCPEKRPWTMT